MAGWLFGHVHPCGDHIPRVIEPEAEARSALQPDANTGVEQHLPDPFPAGRAGFFIRSPFEVLLQAKAPGRCFVKPLGLFQRGDIVPAYRDVLVRFYMNGQYPRRGPVFIRYFMKDP